MIPRYSSPQIEQIWSLENKFSIWSKIECLVAEKLAINGIIPKEAFKEIKNKIHFNVEEIELIEKETKHDVIAYINNVSSYIGENAKYFHHGITSSDIIDTSFSLQLKQSAEIILKELSSLLEILKKQSLLHKNTLMIGRSHGVHAEPITFGIKLASYYCEFKRHLERLKIAKKEISICAISGPVGTFNSIDPSIEEYVAKKMDLLAEKVSTQVIPRDRHAVFFSCLGILASSIERLAIEIRHLQRTEIMEVEETWNTITKIGMYITDCWQEIASENKLPMTIGGLSALCNFSLRLDNWLKYKTYITQEMLKRGYFASNSVYVCIDHTKGLVDQYIDNLNDIFSIIVECEQGKDINSLLEGPICHTGFKRLN